MLSSWELPAESSMVFRAIKIEDELIYMTMDSIHQVYICQCDNGKIRQVWGNKQNKESSKPGEFKNPLGLTLDEEYVYVCDCYNQRLQILYKNSGQYKKQWGNGKESKKKGNFTNPASIFYDLSEALFYVGDSLCVQIFNNDDICIQRFGEECSIDGAFGICLVENCLFVSDYYNQRIHLFERER